MAPAATFIRACRRALHDQRAAAALEFAIIGPIMLLIMAAVTDIGIASVKQMRMSEALSSAVAAVVMGGGSITSAALNSVSGALISTLSSADTTGTITVTVNGDFIATYQGGQSTFSGQTTAADTCRCPTIAAGVLAWGVATDCNAQCADGSTPGKYALVRYTRPYTPLFAQYGFIPPGGLGVQAVVRLQ